MQKMDSRYTTYYLKKYKIMKYLRIQKFES